MPLCLDAILQLSSEKNEVDGSLTSLLTVKLARSDKDDEMGYGYEPTRALIVKAKNTKQYYILCIVLYYF